MRILHVDSERSWRGGQQQVLLLMRRQRAEGDVPFLAAPRQGALYARASAEGFRVHPVPMRGAWDVPSILALATLHRRIRPDVAHWHAARAHLIGALAARIAPGPALVLSRRVDFPVRGSLGSKLLYALPVDAIAAISGAVRDAMTRSGVDPARIRIVPSGIDPAPIEGPFDRARARERLGMGRDEVIGLNVAALAPHKAQGDLLRAAAIAAPRAPLLRIWIVGEGSLRGPLEAQRLELGLERAVRFLGFRDDVPDLLRAADFFCISSRLEGLGTSILEAMAAGLPVVATGAGGISEIVEADRTGLLVTPGDPRGLADALVVMASDASLRASMGPMGRERAKLYHADRTAKMTRRLYTDVLTARGRLTAVNSTC